MSVILHTESSMGWGGQEIRVVRESVGMMKRGHRVIIAAPEQSTIAGRAREAGIAYLPASFRKKSPLSVARARALIDRERPDIVNTHSSADSWVATIAARLSKTRPRIIRTRHLSTPISPSFLSRLIYDILPDAVMTTGEEIRSAMITGNGFDASKISSVPTGVDLGLYDPARVTPALERRGFSVGMVGVLRSWKGHNFFIEAVPGILKQIPEAVFYVAGDGPQRDNIVKILRDRSLDNEVILLGHREDIPGILASLDVIVHPSYGHEGVPQTLLQALAMKKAVVASDTGAIKEIVIDNTTGFLIQPRSPEQIAARVIELYRRPDLRARFGEEGRRLVESGYSFENMLDAIERVYARLFSNA